MSDQLALCAGGIISADIAVPEHDREVRYYAQVLSTGDEPLWREDLMNNVGMPVIGLGTRTAEFEQLPLQWMPHIQVADVAASAARAIELGGRELMHGKDDNGQSQWAVLLDPNGAAFGIIPVVPAEAMPPVEGDGAAHAGRIAWLDLIVPNASATRDFYRKVVGWSVDDVEMENGDVNDVDFNMVDAHGKPAAGIRHARGDNQNLPPVWLIHLPVGDLAESLRRAQQDGGTIVKKMIGLNGELTGAVIQDPVGAYVALTLP